MHNKKVDNRLNKEERLVREYIERGVADFGLSPVGAQMIRRFANECPELFCSAGISVLERGGDTSGHRYVTVLLLKLPMLFQRLSDPWAYSREEAVRIFTRLMSVDSSLDVRLARQLPSRDGLMKGRALGGPAAERALDILDETSRGRRVVPILSHLSQHFDPVIARKAALLIGKRVQNVFWAERHLEVEDPRVRANAIEAIWGLDNSRARQVLWDCTRDCHNRVAGNAIVGLHILGERESSQQAVQMAANWKPPFRSTAAWAMGKIGDPAFCDDLTRMVKDEHPAVRSAVLKSMMNLRRIAAAEQAKAEQLAAAEKEARDQAAARKAAEGGDPQMQPDPVQMTVIRSSKVVMPDAGLAITMARIPLVGAGLGGLPSHQQFVSVRR